MLSKTIKAVLVLLLLLYIASLSPLCVEAFKIVPFGWLNFLGRTLPGVSVNWSGIGMVLLCSVIVIFALQSFLKWLYSALSSPTAQWPWRWTISLYAFFWILFAVVMGASGAARQTSWLLQFKEPIYKPREYAGLRIASSELEAVLLEGKGDLRKAQSYLAASRRAGFGSWDQYQYVFLTDSSNRVETALIIPRDPEAQRKSGFMVVGESSHWEPQPIDRVADFLRPH